MWGVECGSEGCGRGVKFDEEKKQPLHSSITSFPTELLVLGAILEGLGLIIGDDHGYHLEYNFHFLSQ